MTSGTFRPRRKRTENTCNLYSMTFVGRLRRIRGKAAFLGAVHHPWRTRSATRSPEIGRRRATFVTPTGRGTATQRLRSARTCSRVKQDLVVACPAVLELPRFGVRVIEYHWDWTENAGTVISASADCRVCKTLAGVCKTSEITAAKSATSVGNSSTVEHRTLTPRI
jgi:hypothetical protein